MMVQQAICGFEQDGGFESSQFSSLAIYNYLLGQQ